jgi:threonine dehydratase
MTQQPFPTAAGIAAAARQIDPVFLASPLFEHPGANAALGLRLFAKVESLNPIRSFKGRGTDWWMAHQPASNQPVVSASAGNFGQGLAYACARRGRPLMLFSSTRANPVKLEAMRRLGAEVRQAGEDFDAAKAAARAFADASGLIFLEDGNDRLIAEGAGTIAMEIEQTLTGRNIGLDAMFIPLGNGALLTGMGTWLKAALPGCRVIGVVAENAPAMKLSWESGRIISTESAVTAADGIAVREPVPYALACMASTVDEVLAVSEAQIRAAMTFSLAHFGQLSEAAGAAGLAAVMAHAAGRFAGKTVATVLCGSSVPEAPAV